jgi:serine phosphatase RsbU (regulator of sigma subunit)
MSDGFPERFNERREMLDYARCGDVLARAAGRRADKVIEHFLETAETWSGGCPQEDDETFVVICARDTGGSASH